MERPKSIILALALALGLVTAAAIAAPQPASAAVRTYYVAATGCSDTNPGTDPAAPLCHIQAGANKALQPGDVVQVAAGSYPEFVTPKAAGAAGSPITFTAAPDATVTVGAGQANGFKVSTNWISIHGFTVSGTTSQGIYVTSAASNVSVTGNTVDHTKGVGVYVSGGGNHAVTGNHVSYAGVVSGNTSPTPGIKLAGVSGGSVAGNTADHNSDAGIQLASGTTSVSVSGNEAFGNARGLIGGGRAAPGIDIRAAGNSVVGNYSHDNEDSGVQDYSGGNAALIANNLLVGNGDHGIDMSNVQNSKAANNVVYFNCTSGINVEGGSAGGNAVWNNIATDNAVFATYNGIACSRKQGNIAVSDGAVGTTTVDHNLTFLTTSGTQYYWGGKLTLAVFRTASHQAANDVYADPQWVGGGDFHLTANSPAIGLADPNAPGYVDEDFTGSARDSAPDSGAFEYTGAVEPTTTTTTTPPTTEPPTTEPTTTTSAPTTTIAPTTTVPPTTSPPTTVATTTTVAPTTTAAPTTTTSPPPPSGNNLVGNPGFATDTNGWSTGGSTSGAGVTLSREAGGRTDGFAAQLFNPSGAPAKCVLNDSPNWVGATSAGTYTASIWVRPAVAGESFTLRIREYAADGGSAGSPVSTTVQLTDPAVWQQVTVNFTVTAATAGSNLDLGAYTPSAPANGVCFTADDASITRG
jgi:parallel beta-helix repeat protein